MLEAQDVRIKNIEKLSTPREIAELYPLSDKDREMILSFRKSAAILFIQPAFLFRPLLHPPRVHRDEHADQDRDRNPRKGPPCLLGRDLTPTYTYSEWSLNSTSLFSELV